MSETTTPGVDQTAAGVDENHLRPRSETIIDVDDAG